MQVFTITNNCVFPYIIANFSKENLWCVRVGEIGEGRSYSEYTDFVPVNPVLLGSSLFKITKIEGNQDKCLIFVKCEASLRGKGRIDGDILDHYCHKCIKTLSSNLRICNFCGGVGSRNHKNNPIEVKASGIVANGIYGDLGYFRQVIGLLDIDCIFSIKLCWNKNQQVDSRKYFKFDGVKLLEIFR